MKLSSGSPAIALLAGIFSACLSHRPACSGETSVSATGAATATADNLDFNPTATPTVRWIPPALEVPNAAVSSQQEMKPYSEVISGTEVTFPMLPIPGGKFLMGSPAQEEGRNSDEGPQHEVEIEPFWMGKHEVTWDEFQLWAASLERQKRQESSSTKPRPGDRLADAITRPTKPFADLTFNMGTSGYPAICMTQLAAKCYCKWLTAKTGRYYRLPAEAEWEYACRAGTTTAYSFGDDPADLDDYGWYFDNGGDCYHKVGSKKPNPWGLYDMHGNVSEWVLDQYVPDFYAALAGRTARQPFAPSTTVFGRAVRGGCWDDDPEALRSAARRASRLEWNKDDPRKPQSIWFHTDSTCPGFRVVRPLRIPTAEESADFEPSWKAIEDYAQRQTRTSSHDE